MKLEKTVDMMLSEDYQERFKAEYHQLVYRRNKLQKEIKDMPEYKNDAGNKIMMQWQLRVMDDYIYVLKARAEIEHISLK